jgi:hypothetical protein
MVFGSSRGVESNPETSDTTERYENCINKGTWSKIWKIYDISVSSPGEIWGKLLAFERLPKG